MNMNLLDLFRHADDAQSFAAGDKILAEGSSGHAMYVILEGSVEILVGDRRLDVAGPGEIVGEMALIDSGARSANAIAISDCRLAPVDVRRFTYMVQQTPFFALHVMKVLADRLRRINRLG